MKNQKTILFSAIGVFAFALVLGYAVYRGLYESWALAEYVVTVRNTTQKPVSICVEIKFAAPQGVSLPADRLTQSTRFEEIKPGESVTYSDGPGGGFDETRLAYKNQPLPIESILILSDEPEFLRFSIGGVRPQFRHLMQGIPKGESSYLVERDEAGELVLVLVGE